MAQPTDTAKEIDYGAHSGYCQSEGSGTEGDVVVRKPDEVKGGTTKGQLGRLVRVGSRSTLSGRGDCEPGAAWIAPGPRVIA